MQPGHEADHSLPSIGEVKNCGTIPPFRHRSSWRGAKLSIRTISPYLYVIVLFIQVNGKPLQFI
jgi:hypothetical protein